MEWLNRAKFLKKLIFTFNFLLIIIIITCRADRRPGPERRADVARRRSSHKKRTTGQGTSFPNGVSWQRKRLPRLRRCHDSLWHCSLVWFLWFKFAEFQRTLHTHTHAHPQLNVKIYFKKKSWSQSKDAHTLWKKYKYIFLCVSINSVNVYG